MEGTYSALFWLVPVVTYLLSRIGWMTRQCVEGRTNFEGFLLSEMPAIESCTRLVLLILAVVRQRDDFMTQNNWTIPKANEALCTLYLRLNGYFTTGLIVHSPEWGNNYTEIDCLAVRHPNHIQPDRQVGPSPFLAIYDDRIDLLICETKSVPDEVAFNKRLWSEPVVLERVLQWAGILPNDDIPRVSEQLRPILREGLNARSAQHGVLTAEIRVRGLLCCPPATEDEISTGWCLLGSEILQYANECFNPTIRRDTCSTRYNFDLWGNFLAPIVNFLKNQQSETVPLLGDLYEYLGAA